jgi:protein arginine kinase activator
MLCQNCKKNKATHETVSVINGNKYESYLCDSCYAERFGSLGIQLDLFSDLFEEPNKTSKKVKVCPMCGASFADYERTGLLGCAGCYDVFRSELLPAISRIQLGNTKHVGKVGVNTDEHDLTRQLQSLQAQFEVAMREHRLADANRINRKIYEINKQLYGEKGREEKNNKGGNNGD